MGSAERGGEGGYVEYVTARLPSLHRAAYLLCGGDAHRADDIVQVTITRLYRQWRRAGQADNLDAYVHRMLVHAFVDEKRRRWTRVRLVPAVLETGAGHPPVTGIEDRDALVTALRRLPPRQRAVVVMRFLLDRSIEDVAETLRCSTGTVKSQTSRGLAALREMLPAALGNSER
jgi:RNA polymerase sigma-70 factor (sigma-E family)